jgi:hypothetical protein
MMGGCGRFIWLRTNAPYKMRAHGRVAAVALLHTSPSLPRTVIGLVYNKFKLTKIKLKKLATILVIFESL